MSQSNQFGSAKRRVSYFYDTEIGNYHYGMGHPMKVSCYPCPTMPNQPSMRPLSMPLPPALALLCSAASCT